MIKITVTAIILLLLVTTTAGLHAKIEKKVTDWLVISRILYFILLTASVIHLILRFSLHGLGDLLWILLLIIVYILLETAFRLKRVTFGNPHLTHLLFACLVIILVIGYCWL